MTANNDIVVQRSGGKQFRFRGVSMFNPDKSQQVAVIPLPNTSSASTVLFRYFGQIETISISFGIFNDGADVAGGTHSSTVITIAEQLQYLKDVIFSHEFDTSWTLWDTKDLVYVSASPITVSITNVKYDIKAEASSFVQGSFTAKRGNLGALS